MFIVLLVSVRWTDDGTAVSPSVMHTGCAREAGPDQSTAASHRAKPSGFSALRFDGCLSAFVQ